MQAYSATENCKFAKQGKFRRTTGATETRYECWNLKREQQTKWKISG